MRQMDLLQSLPWVERPELRIRRDPTQQERQMDLLRKKQELRLAQHSIQKHRQTDQLLLELIALADSSLEH